MSKTTAIINLVFFAIGFVGYFLGGWWGGFLSGASLLLILLSTLGRRDAEKAASKIDKNIRDHIVNAKNLNDGD